MTQKSYEHAVQVLKDRFGMRWDGEPEDRGDIVKALTDALGISRGEADKLVDAMIEDGELRYHRGDAITGGMGGVIPGAPAAGMGGAPMGGGTGGTAGVPVVPAALSPGYWQIGAAESEQGSERLTRQGQIDPTQ